MHKVEVKIILTCDFSQTLVTKCTLRVSNRDRVHVSCISTGTKGHLEENSSRCVVIFPFVNMKSCRVQVLNGLSWPLMTFKLPNTQQEGKRTRPLHIYKNKRDRQQQQVGMPLWNSKGFMDLTGRAVEI